MSEVPHSWMASVGLAADLFLRWFVIGLVLWVPFELVVSPRVEAWPALTSAAELLLFFVALVLAVHWARSRGVGNGGKVKMVLRKGVVNDASSASENNR